MLSIICFMVSWSRWWGWCRGQGKGAAKAAKIIVVKIIVMLVAAFDHVTIMAKTAKIIVVMVTMVVFVTLDHVIVIVIVKNVKIILVTVIIKLVVTLDHVIVMFFGQPEGSMVIVCAQRGKVGSMLWWARAIEVHLH